MGGGKILRQRELVPWRIFIQHNNTTFGRRGALRLLLLCQFTFIFVLGIFFQLTPCFPVM